MSIHQHIFASIARHILSTLPGWRNAVTAVARHPVTRRLAAWFRPAPPICRHLLTLLSLVAMTTPGAAWQQNNPQRDSIPNQAPDYIDTALLPFWKSTVMYNESVLMTAKEGGLPEARLLFPAEKILSVRNSALDTVYREGIDWEYADGRLRLLKGSWATSLTANQLFPDTSSGKSFPRKGGGFLLFSEGSFFHQHQLAVTYTHAPDLWRGPIAGYQSHVFRELLRKLKRGSKKSGSKLTVLLFGDSIAEGYNGSKHTGAPPFLPGWGELVAEKLRRFYHTEIEFVNTAVAGMDSRWGVQTVEDRVIRHHPDLVIIAFGMNDGTAHMEADTFKANIRQIIDRVKEQDPNTAFILVAPMLPNPRSTFEGTQRAFLQALQELTGNRIALVDMTGTHAELLEHKSYHDMTGNHINHPNDFLIRWYAQQVLNLLVPPSQL